MTIFFYLFIYFFFLASSWGTHLSIFPICLKCQITIEWSKLSSSATSRVVRILLEDLVRGSGFHDGSQLVIVNFWWPATALLTFKALVSFANFLSHHCTAILHLILIIPSERLSQMLCPDILHSVNAVYRMTSGNTDKHKIQVYMQIEWFTYMHLHHCTPCNNGDH